MPAYFVGVINIKKHEAYAAEVIGPGRASIEALLQQTRTTPSFSRQSAIQSAAAS
jgi:hypothetical protein